MGQLIELFVEPMQLGKDAACGLNEDGAGLGGAHAAWMTIEKPDLKNVLQFVQALCERWLTDAERGRRLDQAALRLDGLSCADQMKP